MIWLYNILIVLLAPFWVPWMIWRSRKRKEAVNWQERTGRYSLNLSKGKLRVWIHAVSVGEVVAATPILRAIRAKDPEAEIVLSVTTSSGHQTARERFAELYDHLVYFPLDVPRFTLNAMATVRPAAVAVMETELWLNFFWAAKVIDAATLVVNGRLSDRSFPRARRLSFFYRTIFGFTDRVLAQTEQDATRLRELGASSADTFGNTKFDEGAAAIEDGLAVRDRLGIPRDALVVVVGSTRSELEEAWVLEAIRQNWESGLWVVHAPRHLERAAALAEAVRSAVGTVSRRSESESGRYLILDTYGELSAAYAAADIAIIGGGFDRLGGQNLIQPLAQGKPVLHGEHMQNFRDVASEAVSVGASRICRSANELGSQIKELIGDPDTRLRMGTAARDLVHRHLGAGERYADEILRLAREAAERQAARRKKPTT